MNKIIKITDDKIFVGKDDGSILETEISNASWDAKVGDEVEVFSSGDTVILSLAKKAKEKKVFPIIKKTVNACQKLLPMIFTGLFAFFTIALIVICALPKGHKYEFEMEFMGVEVTSTIKFKGDEMEMTMSTLDEITTAKYDIEDGKLYEYNTETRKYDYLGEISSTKLSIKEPETGLVLEYEEETMIALRTLSIVFMVISGVLDLTCIAVALLTKRGIIKLEEAQAVQQTTSEEVSETTENTEQ